MKKKYLIITFTILLIVLSIFGYRQFNKKDIHKILEKDEYSYLPKEAKNLVEKVFEESGEVILTEKNKEENIPYLNPKYVEYLTLSSEDKEKVEEIPDIYRIDYVNGDKVDGDTPKRYDLRNVNGNNYVTKLKDQDVMDLCWAFTSCEQAESLIIKNSNSTYIDGTSYEFSPRQLDYATSFDGINNYNNEYAIRPLGFGGNYFMALMALSNGVGFTREATLPFSLSMEHKELSDILNYANSMYEVDSSIMMPTLTNPSSSELDSFVAQTKEYIMEYGGVYVATQAPNKSCATTNTDGTTILRTDNNCVQNSNHAMHIIGWDDDYTYSYCVSNKIHKPASTCTNVKTGTGAWLVRNSWGDSYPYIYMAYDSIDYDVRLTTSVSPMTNKNWDNNYHRRYDEYYILTTAADAQFYSKKINTPEKVQKVKLYVFGDNGTFNLSISSSKEKYRNIKSFTVPHAGLYTVDLSSDNVVITDNSFSVDIIGNGSVYFVKDSIEVFTKNVTNLEPNIKTEDLYLESNGKDYNFNLYSDTKNISSNSYVTYSLKNSGGSNYTNYLSANNNKVAINNLNTNISISKSIPNGVYTLTTTYNGNNFTSKLYLGASMDLSGSGTVSDPYMITNEADLRKMAYKLDAHYKLANDIYIIDEWVPIGTEEDPFTGSLNGDGHKITHLNITNAYDNNGLFGVVMINSSNTTSIKNIVLDEIYINAKGNTGALIGKLTGYSEYNNLITCSGTIDSIYLMNGYVYSNFDNAGALIGSIDAPINDKLGKHTYNINKIYNGVSTGGVASSGLIGFIYGDKDSSYAPTINLTNIHTTGFMDYNYARSGNALFFTGSHGTLVGYGLRYATLNISNVFLNSYYRNYEVTGDMMFGMMSQTITVNKSNIVNIFDSGKTFADFRNSSTYSSWTDFNTNWEIKTVNGVTRFPTLKGMDFKYSDLANVGIEVGQEYNLSGAVLPLSTTSAQKVYVSSNSDDSVVSVTNISDSKNSYIVDAKIKGLKAGTSTLHVYNMYDGYEKDIIITVGLVDATIIFDKNDGSGTTKTQNLYLALTTALDANTFTRTGYKFVNWNTNADGSGTSYNDKDLILLNTTTMRLYAQWSPISYKISYNANGGTGTMRSTNATYDTTVSLRNNTFSREGYTFNGWNTKSDGSGVHYNNQASVRNLTSTDNGEVMLYAEWISNDVPSTYTINGYTVDQNNKTISGIALKTSLSSYSNHFSLGEGYTINVNMGSQSYIYTGSKVTIYKNGVKEAEYTNIVLGDISGDGIVNSADLLQMRQHLLGVKTLSGVYFKAGDIDQNNAINSADLLRIRQHLLGTKLIS